MDYEVIKMGVWVRSQDKEILLNANTFIVQYTINAKTEQYWNIFSNGYNLGKYSTEEKAFKVLDMLSNKIGHLENLKKTAGNLPVNLYVFQMPKDEDV